MPKEFLGRNRSKIILVAVFGLGLLVAAAHAGDWCGTPSTGVETQNPEERKIGGPCEYNTYPGVCTITGVEKTDASMRQKNEGGGPGYGGFEINYRFESKETVPPPWHETVLREQTLQLANSWYPGPEFVEKYQIGVDKKFDCQVMLLTKGTCSPVIFQLATIDTTDYFEMRP